jgi:hypothetical protein
VKRKINIVGKFLFINPRVAIKMENNTSTCVCVCSGPVTFLSRSNEKRNWSEKFICGSLKS